MVIVGNARPYVKAEPEIGDDGTPDLGHWFRPEDRARMAGVEKEPVGLAHPARMIASLCRELQLDKTRNGVCRPFGLSVRQAAEFAGVAYSTAAHHLRRLRKLGLLKLITEGEYHPKGAKKKSLASEFLFMPVAGAQAVCRVEESDVSDTDEACHRDAEATAAVAL